ncbi:MAG: FtsX-like permease family protein [Bacteroidota bacterium]
MLKNYFIISWRNLWRSKFFSFINILGLVIGMTACLLLINYVTFETSFDNFHKGNKNIYRITHDFYQKGELKSQSAAVYSPLAKAILNEIPEISSAVRIHPTSGTVSFDSGNTIQSFNEEDIYFTDASFFNIFSTKTIYGNTKPLQQINTAVLTKETAIKYFGEGINPVGRIFQWHDGTNEATFTVSALIEDMPIHSHLNFDLLLSFSTLERLEANSMFPLQENWGWPGFYTYIKIMPTTDALTIETKINKIVDKYVGKQLKSWNNGAMKFYLQPLSNIHLYSKFHDELSVNGDFNTIQFISIVAIIVLLIAYINYINLSTIRSLERAKEVGIRKVMGSRQGQLIRQFVSESLLINTIALLFSFLLYYMVSPFTHFFSGSAIPNVLWKSTYVLPAFIFLVFLAPILSSLYPAFILSNYKPAAVLKGNFKNSSRGIVLRKGLVILQYVASVAMITGTLIVFEQIHYMRNKDLGVNLEQILILNGPTNIPAEESIKSRMEAFKQTLLQQPIIEEVSVTSAIPGTDVNNISMYKTSQEEWENASTIATMKVDLQFIEMYQAEFIAGRNFSLKNQKDRSGETLVLNEKAAFLLGFNNPEAALQQKVVSAIGEEREVIGIIKNYHQYSVAQDYEPLLFVVDFSAKSYISVKINPTSLNGFNNLNNLLKTIESSFYHYYEGNVFDYFFLDKFFDNQYQAEIRFNRLFSFFSVLALFVAGLGLLGLVSYTTLQRTKEIGIRKVLGASVTSILLLLSKDFIKLILIAFIIAIPLSNYLVTEWLNNFAHRITVKWWWFVLSGILVLFVALFFVVGQTWKASNTKTIDSLRYE